MDKKDELKRLWAEAFADAPAYIDMFFRQVYSATDAITLESDGHVASALHLLPYGFRWGDATLGATYICGAATRRSFRGRGFMRQLLAESLRISFERGDAVCSLLPSGPALYDYYSRSGFAPAFYVRPERYSALHEFHGEDCGEWTAEVVGTDVDPASLYADFSRLEALHPYGYIHSPAQFAVVLADNSLDGGAVAVARDGDGAVAAMAFAVVDDDGQVEVRALYAGGACAATAVLGALRRHFGERPFVVLAPPEGADGDALQVRGMMRVVNAGELLGAVAAQDPALKLAVRLADPLLPVNSHTFVVGRGECHVDDAFGGRLDLDLDIATFARIVASSPETGSVVGFPSRRLSMRLMLE